MPEDEIKINWAIYNEMINSINVETQKSLKKAISEFKNTPGMTIGDLMKILPLDKSQAELITITEITRLYSEREMAKGRELKKQWPDVPVVKSWSTCNDDRVCLACRSFGELDFIDINQSFIHQNTQTACMNPPAHPGCRCWISTTTALGKI